MYKLQDYVMLVPDSWLLVLHRWLRSKEASSAARFIQEVATPEFLAIKSPPMADWAESYVGVIAHALIRFGHWEEIL